ncbi:hypothetical protein N3K63_13120 [Microbacterium sp. W1N]|uniref:hypothetical protein n=1 Tax=Microbacterium festucae TaxID=2977531 RepID=UPI0021C11175|nr:hypothetical protein [Microbacterium festucae]MCT9821219.1 hypothetical protein [Microbacterium festucae]
MIRRAAASGSGSVPVPATPASTVTLRMLERELDAARAARESYITRGVAVVTTAGALVAIFLGVAGLVAGAAAPQVPAPAALEPATLSLLVAAVIAFVASGLVTTAMLWPRPGTALTDDTLRTYAGEEFLRVSSLHMEQHLITATLDSVVDTRRTNAVLAWTLISGLALETLGVVLAAVAVALLVGTVFA